MKSSWWSPANIFSLEWIAGDWLVGVLTSQAKDDLTLEKHSAERDPQGSLSLTHLRGAGGGSIVYFDEELATGPGWAWFGEEKVSLRGRDIPEAIFICLFVSLVLIAHLLP